MTREMNPFALELRQYVKALVGGLIAALSLVGGALGDGLSSQEWVGIAIAFLTGFAGVFYADNKAPKGRPADPDLSEQDGRDLGHADASYLVLGLLVLLVVLWAVGILR